MLSKAQIIVIHCAARQAQLPDGEYREALQLIAGVESSKDKRVGERHFDQLMSYMEAIYWRKVDGGERGAWSVKRYDPFKTRDFWKNRNQKGNTSRDRYVSPAIAEEIQELEAELNELGYHQHYCAKILENILQEGTEKAERRAPTVSELLDYRAALRRTVNAKRRKAAA